VKKGKRNGRKRGNEPKNKQGHTTKNGLECGRSKKESRKGKENKRNGKGRMVEGKSKEIRNTRKREMNKYV
jgi:hypothetical protein